MAGHVPGVGVCTLHMLVPRGSRQAARPLLARSRLPLRSALLRAAHDADLVPGAERPVAGRDPVATGPAAAGVPSGRHLARKAPGVNLCSLYEAQWTV